MSTTTISIPSECLTYISGCCCPVSITWAGEEVCTVFSSGTADVDGCCAPTPTPDSCPPGNNASWETKQVTNLPTPGFDFRLWCGEDDVTDEATWLLEIVDRSLAGGCQPMGAFISGCGGSGVDPTVTLSSSTDPNAHLLFTGLLGLSDQYSCVWVRATATWHGVEYVYEYADGRCAVGHTRLCIAECPP